MRDTPLADARLTALAAVSSVVQGAFASDRAPGERSDRAPDRPEASS